MKKQWENPELNGLGVNETNEGGTIAKYERISTLDVEGTDRWRCLGVFNIHTGENIIPCGLEFNSYVDWAIHAKDHRADTVQGESGLGATPIS